jgi:hypothetical protein
MAIIGGQINPAYYPQPDYSGVVRSAQMQSQGIAKIGQQIGGAIKQYGEDEKTIKKSAQMAKSIRDAIPELADMANNSLEQLSNPDLSQRDRLAIAEGIQDSLKIGVMGLENKRSNAMLQLEAAKIAAAANAPKKVSKTTIGLGDGSEMDVLIDESGNMTDVFGNPIGGQGTQGAGASVQNALPQAQGGNFPDGIPTAADTPMPEVGNYPNYGSFDQATQGVAIDGAPGVLPPRQPVANQPQYGVRSPKSKEKFRSATKEELAAYGAIAGQVEESSGKFYPINPPSGMEIKSDGEGGFTLIQGSGAGQKTQGATEARKRISEQGLGVVLENLGSVYDQINKVSDSALGAAAQSQIAKLLPATEIGAIKDQIETVNNNISFDTVNQLRASSTTGSAGGNITEKEWPRFEGRLGKIYVGQNKDLFTKNVKSIAYTMYDAVNGTPEEVDKLLDENKITQQDYNNYLSERSALRMKFGSVNSTNPIEEAKSPKATDNPLNLSPETEEILKGL